MAAELMVGRNQVGIERLALRVGGVAVGAHRKRSAADVAELPIQLPPSEDPVAGAAAGHCVAVAEGQVVDAPDFQVVGLVETGGSAVASIVPGIVPRQTAGARPGPVVLEVDSVGVSVDEARLRELAAVVSQLRLQAVVLGTEQGLHIPDTARVIAGPEG